MTEGMPERGLLSSLRRLGATLLALAHTRLELVSVEIEEQFEHAAAVLLWSFAALYFTGLALLVLAITIVIAFWDTHRLLAAALVTAALASIAIGAVIVVRVRLRRRPRFLSATSAELARDAAALDGDES